MTTPCTHCNRPLNCPIVTTAGAYCWRCYHGIAYNGEVPPVAQTPSHQDNGDHERLTVATDDQPRMWYRVYDYWLERKRPESVARELADAAISGNDYEQVKRRLL